MITVELKESQLKILLDNLTHKPGEIYKLTFAIDGGIKVKVNEYSWSPPYGEVRQ